MGCSWRTHRLGDFLLGIRTDRFDIGVGDETEFLQLIFEKMDRIAICDPVLDFFLGAIAIAIALGMAAVTIGLAFDKRRPFTPARPFDGSVRGLGHIRQIVTVNDHARHVICDSPVSDIGDRSRTLG